MFSNIGGKIKMLAKILCWLGIILSVVFGILFITSGSPMYINGEYTSYNGVALGIVTIIFGCLASWVGSFFAYGFGQLIENTDYIRSNTQHRD